MLHFLPVAEATGASSGRSTSSGIVGRSTNSSNVVAGIVTCRSQKNFRTGGGKSMSCDGKRDTKWCCVAVEANYGSYASKKAPRSHAGTITHDHSL